MQWRNARHRLARALAVVAVVVGLTPVATGTAAAATRNFTDIGVTRNGQGYALISENGEVYAFGTVQYRGNPLGFTGKMVGISVTDDGLGYVAISSAGQVYAFGTAVYRGNPTGFTGQIVDVSVTSDGLGYVAISSAGQVYAFGSVVYRGNPVGFGGTISSISTTPNGQGYAAISTGGQVYAFNVVYRGNPSGFSGSMKSISVTANGQGYLAMSSAGQMYAFNVAYRGNPTGYTGSMVGVGVTADGQGYAAASSYGQVYAFGTVVYRGNGDAGAVTAPPPPAPIAPTCVYDSCTGKDPKTYGCELDGRPIAEFTDGSFRFELRYSSQCNAGWARVTTLPGTEGWNCNTAFAQVRAYDAADNRVGVYGVQAACPGQAWTQMFSFRYYLRACESTWFDGEPRYCTDRR
jgi:hypothetical protein